MIDIYQKPGTGTTHLFRDNMKINELRYPRVKYHDRVDRFIYFVKFADHVKIGISTDLKSRLKILKSSNPFAISYSGMIIVDNKIKTRVVPLNEKDVHEIFHKYHISGEWFKFDNIMPLFVSYTRDYSEYKSMGIYMRLSKRNKFKHGLLAKYDHLSKSINISKIHPKTLDTQQ